VDEVMQTVSPKSPEISTVQPGVLERDTVLELLSISRELEDSGIISTELELEYSGRTSIELDEGTVSSLELERASLLELKSTGR